MVTQQGKDYETSATTQTLLGLPLTGHVYCRDGGAKFRIGPELAIMDSPSRLPRGDEMKVLKIHNLEKGWCDKDHVMLHAAFQLLVDFVEKERPDETVYWNSEPEHKHTWKEIRSLYKWWTKRWPIRNSFLHDKKLKRPPLRFKRVPGADLSQLVDYDKKKYPEYEKAFKEHWRLERKWEEEDQRNFHRLVDIRGFLWT